MTGLGLKALSRNVGAIFVRQIFAALLNLLTVVLIARVYGPEGNGAFAVALLLPSVLATLLNLGVAPANVYHLGSKHYTARQVLAANLRIFLLFGVLGLVIGASALGWKSERVFPGVGASILWFALAVFPISLLNSYLQSVFQGLQQFRPLNLLSIAQPALLLMFVAILTAIGNQEIVWLVAAHLMAVVIVLGMTVLWLRPYLGEKDSTSDHRGTVTKTLGYGWKAHLSNILAFVNYKADVFLANFFLGPGAVGVYVIAVALAEKLWLMSQAVSTVLLPRLAEMNSDEAKRKELTPLITRWLLLATLLAAVALALVAGWLIALIFGAEYAGALLPLWILLPGIVFGAASRVLANDIAARGRPELNMYTSIFVVIINVIGNVLLIPSFGIEGAAAATSIAYTLNLILRMMIYRWFTGNKWIDVLVIKIDDFRYFRILFMSGTLTIPP